MREKPRLPEAVNPEQEAANKAMIEEYERQEKLEKEVVALLGKLRLRVRIGGCGCCGSPWVKIEHGGDVIVDERDFCLDMFGEEEK